MSVYGNEYLLFYGFYLFSNYACHWSLEYQQKEKLVPFGAIDCHMVCFWVPSEWWKLLNSKHEQVWIYLRICTFVWFCSCFRWSMPSACKAHRNKLVLWTLWSCWKKCYPENEAIEPLSAEPYDWERGPALLCCRTCFCPPVPLTPCCSDTDGSYQRGRNGVTEILQPWQAKQERRGCWQDHVPQLLHLR